MLSKSAARAFFLGGTALCTLAFLALTFDTFQKIPDQTRAADITPSVARGKSLWDQNNCMGCHTLLGEGAYYAPELTKVMDRRGETFVRSILKDPQAMYPGQRNMVNYHFDDAQIDDLVAFLSWIGRMDLNGFPPEPSLAGGQTKGDAAASARPATFNQTCIACHSVAGKGGQVGPALDGVGKRLSHDYLVKWLKDPQGVKPGTAMPKLGLTEPQIEELVTYLSTLGGENLP